MLARLVVSSRHARRRAPPRARPLVAGRVVADARLAARRRGAGHHPRPVPLRLVQVPDPQERAHLRDAARHRRDLLRPADVGRGTSRSPQRGWWAWARRAPAVLPRPRRPGARRHDALHPRPDLLRVGDRADAPARRHHVLPAAAQQGRDSADGHRGHGGGRVRLGHPRRRVDDRPDHPHAGDHPACWPQRRSRRCATRSWSARPSRPSAASGWRTASRRT